MSRLFVSAEILVQATSHHTPQSFRWRGNLYTVSRTLNHWRVDREWWRERIARDYFQLMTTTGMVVTLYRDRLNDTWFIQRLYD